ncbi:MAG: DoxX family protein [Caulobacterales bacterium]|nr:DoxX family protein [Caulobacterales bacterium]
MDNLAASKAGLWTGRVMTTLFVLFMLMDAGMKLVPLTPVVETMTKMQLPVSMARPIGIIELVSLALFLWPRTAVLGAVLLTGVFGGAIASHWRLGDPLFSHVLFGVYLGILMWGGLWLRDPRLRAIMPLRS